MPTSLQSHADYITKVRRTITTFMETTAELNDLRSEYTFAGLNGILSSSDFSADANSDITLAQFTAIMTSIDNLNTWLNAGNGTNFSVVRLQ